MSNRPSPELLEQLARLHADYRRQLPDKLAAIDATARHLVSGPWQLEFARASHQQVHKLAGSAGTFDMPEVGDIARALELALTPFLEEGAVPTAQERAGIVTRLKDLCSAIDRALSGETATYGRDAAINKLPLSNRNNLVYVVEDDSLLARIIAARLSHEGYTVRLFGGMQEFLAACATVAAEKTFPAAVIMDIILPEGRDAGFDVIADMKRLCGGQLPVIFISVRDDLGTRLRALRLGATRYLAKPLDIDRLVQLLDDLTQRVPSEPYRVLLVDDDEDLLAHYRTLLYVAGMEVHVVSNPLQALEAATHFRPDVIVLDVYMPECTGLELAAILRADQTWAQTPIMYLSVESNLHKQLVALDLGGDEFLTKPVEPAYFVMAVAVRAKRSRHLRQAADNLRHALRERDQRQKAFDQHVIVSVSDTHGRIIYANSKFIDISGYSLSELLGQNHRILKSGVHPASFYDVLWKTIAAGQVWKGEICNRNKDGGLYWVESTIVPFLDADGQPYQYISVRTDITHIKKAEAALRASEERLNFLVSSSPVTIYTCAATPPFAATYISPNVKKIMGYDPERFTENPGFWADNIHPDDRQQVFDQLPKLFEHGVHEHAYRFRMPDGSYRWMHDEMQLARNADGEAVEIIGYWADITRRKHSEAALQDSEERLRLTQVSADLGAWDWDIASGRVEFNERWAAMRGYRLEEVAPHVESWKRDVHPDDMVTVNALLEEHFTERSPFFQVEYRVRAKSGDWVWILDRGAVVKRDEKGWALRMVGIEFDISARKRVEQELADHKERLRRGQVYANIGTWDWNIQTGGLIWSERIAPLFGYPAGDLDTTYDNFIAAIHPDDRQAVIDAVTACVERDAPYQIEHRVVWPDGTVRWLQERGAVLRDASGTALQMLGVVQDIDDRKRAELALQASQAKLSGLFDLSPLGIALTDMNGRYLEFNEAFRAICGYPSEELRTMDYWALTPPEYAERESMQLEALQRTGRYGPYEKAYRQKNGQLIPIRLNGILVKDAAGNQEIWSIVEDITDHKQAERALIAAREAADRANHAKSEFLSSMSHELRTPMNAILGFAQLLEIDAGLNTEQQDEIQEILKAGHHLLELINEVLDLARIEAGRIDLSIEPVLCSELLHACLSLVRPLAEQRGIGITTVDDCDGVWLRADRVRLKQVLLNLLSNAIKYNQPQGKVSLSVTTSDTGRVRIHVRDTGPGIPPSKITDLFQPFNRLGAETTDVEGSGIGLVISRRLIEMMGGRIGVESIYGKGSDFWLELQRDDVYTAPAGKPVYGDDVTTVLPKAALRTLLYIEDNPANLKLVSQILARRPHLRLLTAHTPALGLDLAAVHHPELILLDIGMPDMDGYEVLALLRAQDWARDLPIVAITANAMPSDIRRGQEAGFTEYLTKPLDVARFLAVIDRALHLDGEHGA